MRQPMSSPSPSPPTTSWATRWAQTPMPRRRTWCSPSTNVTSTPFLPTSTEKVGLANVLVGFTADHGVAPHRPMSPSKLGVASGSHRTRRKFIDSPLMTVTEQARFSPAKKTNYFLGVARAALHHARSREPSKRSVSTEKDAEVAVVEAGRRPEVAALALRQPPLDTHRSTRSTAPYGLTFSESRKERKHRGSPSSRTRRGSRGRQNSRH